jgi:hypothetical protein
MKTLCALFVGVLMSCGLTNPNDAQSTVDALHHDGGQHSHADGGDDMDRHRDGGDDDDDDHHGAKADGGRHHHDGDCDRDGGHRDDDDSRDGGHH